MGVDYEYCGECRECLYEGEFTRCHNENCDNEFWHPCDHGRYCIDCGIEKKLLIMIDDMYFCNRKCYRIYKKESDKELMEEERKKQDEQLIQLKKISINY